MAAASSSSDVMQTSNCQLSEAIQTLCPELLEILYEKFVAIKMRERKEMGWNEVLYEFKEAPFCEKRLRITKILFCRKCNTCGKNGLCYECHKNRKYHYLGYPIYRENDYDEKLFQKFY